VKTFFIPKKDGSGKQGAILLVIGGGAAVSGATTRESRATPARAARHRAQQRTISEARAHPATLTLNSYPNEMQMQADPKFLSEEKKSY
jgi:hypothetical protein